MIFGSILQIIGIILTGTGSLLAITKLWQGYIEESKRKADFWVRNWKEYQKYKTGSSESEKTEKDMKKIILNYYFLERKFICIGIALILTGMILQIIGTIMA